jgi:hypothetical protein
LKVLKHKILFILPFIFFFSALKGQGWLTEENNIETNWNVTLQLGSTILLSEIKNDFSGSNTNMTNKPGLGMNIQLSKMVWERVDMGTEFGMMSYSGINKNPTDINFLKLSGNFNNSNAHFLPYPVAYSTDVYNIAVFTKYNFVNLSTYPRSYIKINLYVKVGIGLAYLVSEMGYKEKGNYELSGLTAPLFSSARDLNFFNRISGYVCPAFGINYQISDRIFVSAEMNFLIFNTGLIDGVYNVSKQLPPGIVGPIPNEYLVKVSGVAGKFMVGCTYFFNIDSHRQTRWDAFPWYYNRYRSYFSKYHNPSSKRKIKERLPFYNNEFDE